MNPRCLFFIGKGGVGKSTSSALTAVHKASQGSRTLLVSMDPAHNQRDIFEQNFSEKPMRVADRLQVKEIDTDYWIKKYLKETQHNIQATYRYQSAFNIQSYFNVLQFSPGVEEYALLLAFENVIHTCNDQDVIIFDMAPTALTLRFFSLPFITLIWLDELLKLRTQIYEKKEIISKIKIGRKEIEQDKIKSKLNNLINNYEHLRDHFLSKATQINLVMNNDLLSLSEAIRIREKLKAIGMPIERVVVNKLTKPDEDIHRIDTEFREQSIVRLPLAKHWLAGYPRLKEYIEGNPDAFQEYLQ
jgi:arsenite-transporting ATPase